MLVIPDVQFFSGAGLSDTGAEWDSGLLIPVIRPKNRNIQFSVKHCAFFYTFALTVL